MTIAAGLVLALASAFALNWGWIAQHAAASALPPLELRRPIHSLVSLFSESSLARRLLVGLAGWALYVGALALAPLSLVQATSAGGIGLLALLAHRGGARVSVRERNGVLVATLGLGLLALSLVGGAAAGREGRRGAVAAWLLVSAAVAGSRPRAVARSRRRKSRSRGGRPLRRGRRRDEDGLRGRALARASSSCSPPRSCVRRAAARLPAGRRSRDRGNLDAADKRAADRGGNRHLPRAASGRRLTVLRVAAFAAVVAGAGMLAR